MSFSINLCVHSQPMILNLEDIGVESAMDKDIINELNGLTRNLVMESDNGNERTRVKEMTVKRARMR